MKRLALLLVLLATPAVAADTIALQIGGGAGGACNVANVNAGNFTCTATITEQGTPGTWHTELITTYQDPCNKNINGTCTVVQVLTYIKTVVIQSLKADVDAFKANTALSGAGKMATVN